MAEKEAYATDRLAVLEVDAQKRAAAVETLRQEAARDLTHGRLRLDSEAAEMRCVRALCAWVIVYVCCSFICLVFIYLYMICSLFTINCVR